MDEESLSSTPTAPRQPPSGELKSWVVPRVLGKTIKMELHRNRWLVGYACGFNY